MADRTPLFNIRPVVTPEAIEAALDKYFDNNPNAGDEPGLTLHILDETPHPVYDNLAAGRFIAKLQNGMA